MAVENARLCENLRFYVRQITSAQEDERKRIARDLHDDMAQRLIALSRRLDGLVTSEMVLSESGVEELEQLQQRIEDILQGVRRFSRDLRPSVLDDLGLLPALEGLLADVQESGLAAALEISGDRHCLSPDVELGLFRIVQEALNNVQRQAEASHAVVDVQFSDSRARVAVRDDGQGFELLASTSDFATIGRFGLLEIEERTQLLRGHFQVQSGRGKGTIVSVGVPA